MSVVVQCSKNRPIRAAGGGATVAGLLVTELSRRGIPTLGLFGLSIFDPTRNPIFDDYSPRLTELMFSNLRQFYYRPAHLVAYLRYLRDILYFALLRSKYTRLSNTRVLHAHDTYSACALFPSKFAKDALKILTIHSKGDLVAELLRIYPYIRNTSLESQLKLYDTIAIHAANIVVFPSHSALSLYKKSRPDLSSVIDQRSVIIHNGVEDLYPQFASKPKNDHNYLINIAQHVPEKGVDITIEALALLKSSYSRQVQLVNLGSYTPLTPYLQKKSKSLGVDHNITWLGTVPHHEALRLLHGAQIYITTPRHTVFDLATLEAMSLAIPIVATPVPGNVEALGESYQFFASTPQEIAEKIATLLSDRKLRIDVGSMLRERYLQMFTVNAMCDRHMAVYNLR